VEPALLLPPGPDLVALYADASFAHEVGIGCWAFAVPAFPVHGAGIEPAPSCNRLELAGVVRGIANVVGVDRSGRALRVFTDSDFVIGLMAHVVKRVPMPDKKGYRPVADLYAEACDLTTGRRVDTVQRPVGDPHHAGCDRRAREGLRRYCVTGEVARRICLARVQARRIRIEQEIRSAEKGISRLYGSLLQCDMEIAAMTTPALMGAEDGGFARA
jgi:ribonuclease HI